MSTDEMITSLQNPRVKQVVRLRDRRDRDRESKFLIEGYRELSRAVAVSTRMLQSQRRPVSIRR